MAGIVVVGAGHAGIQLVVSLRDEGYEGAIDLISADADHPYHKPPLSKSFMQGPDIPLQPLQAEPLLRQKGIDLHLGQVVTRIDRAGRRVELADGFALDYDKLVLATGSRARELALPGVDLPGVYMLRNAADARRLREALPLASRVAVVGGGFIGLEAAAMLRARGMAVTLVELAPRLLGRAVSPEIAEAVRRDLVAAGVELLLGQSIEAVAEADGRASGLRLPGRVLEADLVILGVGAVPVDALAKEAGLTLANGIAVDAQLRTSDENIYAIGDCAAFPQVHLGRVMRLESVQNATDQARALSATLCGRPADYRAVPWFWSDIGKQKLQIAGLLDGADASVLCHGPDGNLRAHYHLRQGVLAAVETINSNAEHMLARRMIAEGFTPSLELMRAGDPHALKAALQARDG